MRILPLVFTERDLLALFEKIIDSYHTLICDLIPPLQLEKQPLMGIFFPADPESTHLNA